MLLSYVELVEVVKQGVITDVEPEHINGGSIDLILGDNIYVEKMPDIRGKYPKIDLTVRQSIEWIHAAGRMVDGGYLDLEPGEFILAHTLNKFHMPNNLSAEFSLKSSIARNGLEHMLAGWIDPGFNNSVLTLEMKNCSRGHRLRIKPGMLIGQVKFFQHTPVPDEFAYGARGRYNNDNSLSPIKP